jgi:5'-nucleotidase
MLASVVTAGPAAATGVGKPFCLFVLHNNDGESDLLPESSSPDDFGGVAHFGGLVNALRRDATTRSEVAGQQCGTRGTLMLSSGDNFLAGVEFDASLQKGVPFFDSIALDTIGYGALVIGNHEFDFGPDVLADFIEGFTKSGPFISANLDFSGEPRLAALESAGRIAKSVVERRAHRDIGIIGATTERLATISSPRNVKVLPVVENVQAEIDRLIAAGVNKIIFVSHLQSIEEDKAVLAQLRGVDIAIAGGGDELLANPGTLLVPGDSSAGPYPTLVDDADGKQIPLITTSGGYNYVGRLMVTFDKNGEISGIDAGSGPVRVAGGTNADAATPKKGLERQVEQPVRAAIEASATTEIGITEVGLDGIRGQIRTVETNLGNLIADSQLWQARQLAASFGVSLPEVAIQNGGGIRNDDFRGPGVLTDKDTFDILPFANFVSVIEGISIAQFKEILENAVSRVAFGDGRFAQISGFKFTWDPAGQPQIIDPVTGVITQTGERVRYAALVNASGLVTRELIIDGVVQRGAPLTIASIDFLLRGGDQYPYGGAPFTSLGVTYKQALVNFIDNGLGGTVNAADYPVGGEGRITRAP